MLKLPMKNKNRDLKDSNPHKGNRYKFFGPFNLIYFLNF